MIATIASCLLALAPAGGQASSRRRPPAVTYAQRVVPVDAIRGHLAEGDFKEPSGVFFDPQADELYVTDMKNALIGIYGPSGVPLFTFGGPALLVDPKHIVVSPEGPIYVLDSETTGVKVFSYRGEPRAPIRFAAPEAPPDAPPDAAPVRMSTFTRDGAGNWYVADADTPRVIVYGPDRTPKLVIPRPDGVGEFGLITGLAVSAEGLIAVIDHKATPVQIFDAQGRFVSGFGSRDIGLGNFTAPMDVAFDEQGYLYVVDMLRHDVKVFDVQGRLQTVFGGWFSPETRGRGPGEMLYPTGIAIAPERLIYVAERFGNRVQIFERRAKATNETEATKRPR